MNYTEDDLCLFVSFIKTFKIKNSNNRQRHESLQLFTSSSPETKLSSSLESPIYRKEHLFFPKHRKEEKGVLS